MNPQHPPPPRAPVTRRSLSIPGSTGPARKIPAFPDAPNPAADGAQNRAPIGPYQPSPSGRWLNFHQRLGRPVGSLSRGVSEPTQNAVSARHTNDPCHREPALRRSRTGPNSRGTHSPSPTSTSKHRLGQQAARRSEGCRPAGTRPRRVPDARDTRGRPAARQYVVPAHRAMMPGRLIHDPQPGPFRRAFGVYRIPEDTRPLIISRNTGSRQSPDRPTVTCLKTENLLTVRTHANFEMLL